MKALTIILYIVLALAAIVVALGLFAQKEYHIERSIEIDAPASMVYDYVRHFKNYHDWAPWPKLDPNMQSSIEGQDGEAGAVYSWSGNKKVGKGKQELKKVSPERIETDVTFTEPWEAVSPTFMTFEPVGKKTKVSWGMDMKVPFPWNGFAMFTNMDLAIGKDYEKGLDGLKKATEAIAHKKYLGFEVAEGNLPELFFVGVRKQIPLSKLPDEYSQGLRAIITALQKNNIEASGMPAGLYWGHDGATQMLDVAVSVPIATNQTVAPFNTFTIGGRALVVDYYGNYEDIATAHEAMDSCMADRGLKQRYPVVEQYITDPNQEPDTSKWLSKVIYFVE